MKGLAYVDFSDDEHLAAAVAKNKRFLLGKKVSIARSDPKGRKGGSAKHSSPREYGMLILFSLYACLVAWLILCCILICVALCICTSEHFCLHDWPWALGHVPGIIIYTILVCMITACHKYQVRVKIFR